MYLASPGHPCNTTIPSDIPAAQYDDTLARRTRWMDERSSSLRVSCLSLLRWSEAAMWRCPAHVIQLCKPNLELLIVVALPSLSLALFPRYHSRFFAPIAA